MRTSYQKVIRASALSIIPLFVVVGFFTSLPKISRADEIDFASMAKKLTDNQGLVLSASWNGILLSNGATTTLPAGQTGQLSFAFSPNPTYIRPLSIGDPGPVNSVLSSAVLTLDLYRGAIGSSTLLYSQTIASTTPSVIPVSFGPPGTYFLVLSATYPDGTYPPGKGPSDICGGDFCLLPSYSLTALQAVMTNGAYLFDNSLGSFHGFIPAAYGMLEINISKPAQGSTSNVLFLPGTMESRLYMRNALGLEQELWEPLLDHDVSLLALNPDGTSKRQIYTRDVLDYLYAHTPLLAQAVRNTVHDKAVMYGPFEKFMDQLVAAGTLKEWRAYPYDWRFDVSDVVKDGTLVGNATGTPKRVYLDDVVEQLASTSPTGKVTVVAHSNGGLLAKALGVELQREGKLALLDRMILVGTPQLGTPETIGAMLHGDTQTPGPKIVMSKGTARTVTQTMPGPYDLLPSLAYFNKVQAPVVSFGDDVLDAPYRAQYGANINSYQKFADFVTNVGNVHGTPASTDFHTPITLSGAYLQKAQATHAAIDSWVPPTSLPITSIAGWGQWTSFSYPYSAQPFGWGCSIRDFFRVHCGSLLKFDRDYIEKRDGDDTVLSASADSSGTPLYLDTKRMWLDGIGTTTHQSLLSAIPIQKQIKDILTGNSTTEQYVSATQPIADANESQLIVSAHSPINLLATDAAGNQSGIVSIAGFPDFYFIKEDIPGSSVQTRGDEKYISLPAIGDYSFSYQGYASGETTIAVSSVGANGVATNTQMFSAIPTTASTTATFSVSQGIATAPAVDVYGTGNVDLIASSSITNTSTSTILRMLEDRVTGSTGLPKLRALFTLLIWKIDGNAASSELRQTLDWLAKLLGVQNAPATIDPGKDTSDEAEP